jgi:tyrosyl-tRNA synthetase
VEHRVPDEMPELDLSSAEADGMRSGDDGEVHLPLLISSAFAISTSEARRLLNQGAVRLDGEALDGQRLDLPTGELSGKVLQVGKRRFLRLTGSPSS